MQIKASEGICKLLGHLTGSARVGGGQGVDGRIFRHTKAQLLLSTLL